MDIRTLICGLGGSMYAQVLMFNTSIISISDIVEIIVWYLSLFGSLILTAVCVWSQMKQGKYNDLLAKEKELDIKLKERALEGNE
jgi:hypothetical protein